MMKHVFAMTALATASLAALAIPTPAMAQGTVGKMSVEGQCPKGYEKAKRGSDATYYCYPGRDAKPAYPKEGRSCADGYEQQHNFCVVKAAASSSSSSSSSSPNVDYIAAQSGTGAMLTKSSKGNRCPTGWASTRDLTQCFTMVENPPTARPSGGKPCAPGEFNDYDVWCTSNYGATTKEQAHDAETVDFNRLYTGGFQSIESGLSADAIAHFGPKIYADSSTSASSSGSSKPAEQTVQCDTSGNGSATGAAVGGAVAGEAGAVLGSVLGGLGKKKKKKAAGC
jgi:hypothetical protein